LLTLIEPGEVGLLAMEASRDSLHQHGNGRGGPGATDRTLSLMHGRVRDLQGNWREIESLGGIAGRGQCQPRMAPRTPCGLEVAHHCRRPQHRAVASMPRLSTRFAVRGRRRTLARLIIRTIRRWGLLEGGRVLREPGFQGFHAGLEVVERREVVLHHEQICWDCGGV
jgi:hypothetical protein